MYTKGADSSMMPQAPLDYPVRVFSPQYQSSVFVLSPTKGSGGHRKQTFEFRLRSVAFLETYNILSKKTI